MIEERKHVEDSSLIQPFSARPLGLGCFPCLERNCTKRLRCYFHQRYFLTFLAKLSCFRTQVSKRSSELGSGPFSLVLHRTRFCWFGALTHHQLDEESYQEGQ